MTVLVLVTNTVQLHPHISNYFWRTALPRLRAQRGERDSVDFRALDTLGEISVLALAGIGVFALLKLRPHPAQEKADVAKADVLREHRAQVTARKRAGLMNCAACIDAEDARRSHNTSPRNGRRYT
jgi:hypothetical protein